MASRLEVLQWVNHLRREAAGIDSKTGEVKKDTCVLLAPEQALILASILFELCPPAVKQ